MGIIAEKYARALIISASKNNAVENIKSDFRFFLDYLEKNAKLRFILINWSLPYETEKKVLTDVFAEKLNPLFLRFLQIVLKRKREKEFACIYENYCRLADEYLCVLRVKIITACPISTQQKVQLESILKNKYDQDIILENEINPYIIGGGIVKIKDKIIDISIKNRLENLRKELIT